MIVLITFLNKHRTDANGIKHLLPENQWEITVSHGIDSFTMENVCLQQESLSWYKRNCNVYFNNQHGWVLLE